MGRIIINIWEPGVSDEDALAAVLAVVKQGKISKNRAGEPYYCWHTTVNNTIDVSTNVKTRPTETNTFTISKHRGTNE